MNVTEKGGERIKSCIGRWDGTLIECQLCLQTNKKLAEKCKRIMGEKEMANVIKRVVPAPAQRVVSKPTVVKRVVKAPAQKVVAKPVAKAKVAKVAPAKTWIDNPEGWRPDSHKGYTRDLIAGGYSRPQIVAALKKEFWSNRADADKLANRYITYVARTCGLTVKEAPVTARATKKK